MRTSDKTRSGEQAAPWGFVRHYDERYDVTTG